MLKYLYRMEKGGDIVLALFMAIENEDDRSLVIELYEKHAKYIYERTGDGSKRTERKTDRGRFYVSSSATVGGIKRR